jgi:7-keto-8-aminopelargonate synthetase-like enzyme
MKEKNSVISKPSYILKKYDELKMNNLWFYYSCYKSGKRTIDVQLDGKNYILFSTNNYLGLSKNQNCLDAAVDALREYGIGTGASFAVTGGTLYHQEFAEDLRDFYQYEDAIITSSGYMANSAVITALLEKNTTVICDEFIHISFLNAIKLTQIHAVSFQHNNIIDLEKKLKEERKKNANNQLTIITESLFSQHGDIVRAVEISKLAKAYGALLIIDDAHGLGTIGEKGYGILEYYGLTSGDVPVLTGAMNKALGCHGGYILSTKQHIEIIKAKAYELIFTSSLPALIMAAGKASLKEIRTNPQLFTKLKQNVLYFRDGVISLNLEPPRDITPIFPMIFGSMKETCLISQCLQEAGIIAIPMIPPAVPMGSSRIRFQITAEHTFEDIDKCIAALKVGLARTIRTIKAVS